MADSSWPLERVDCSELQPAASSARSSALSWEPGYSARPRLEEQQVSSLEAEATPSFRGWIRAAPSMLAPRSPVLAKEHLRGLLVAPLGLRSLGRSLPWPALGNSLVLLPPAVFLFSKARTVGRRCRSHFDSEIG